MPRGPCDWKQSSATKALKAARAAGLPVARLEIDREGKIVVLIGTPVNVETPKISDASENDFGG